MSSRTFTGGWLVAAVLLATWALSSASGRQAAPPAAQVPASVALPAVSADLNERIARLEAWTAGQTVPSAMRRNPFTFDVRSSTLDVRETVDVPTAKVDLTEAPPSTSTTEARTPDLSAVAHVSGVLTAVISFNDTLHYVTKGDVVAARYRVDAVTADAVDVFDLTLGTILRLTLRR